MEKVAINTESINLDQFLKWIGVVDTGGQVKLMLEDRSVLVNNNYVHERRKKLKPGDIVEIKSVGSWLVTDNKGEE